VSHCHICEHNLKIEKSDRKIRGSRFDWTILIFMAQNHEFIARSEQ